MNPVCNIVAERVALGESLAEHAEHAASCERCQRVIALPASLATVRGDDTPGAGFAARLTVGTQKRLVERRRNRIIATVSMSAAAAAVIFFVATRVTDQPQPTVATQAPRPVEPDTVTLDAADLKFLVTHADVDRSAHLSADWKHIKKPLVRYASLIKGIKP